MTFKIALDLLTKYSVNVMADGVTVVTYEWLATAPLEAQQELEEALAVPFIKELMEVAFPQTKDATLSFEVVT